MEVVELQLGEDVVVLQPDAIYIHFVRLAPRLHSFRLGVQGTLLIEWQSVHDYSIQTLTILLE